MGRKSLFKLYEIKFSYNNDQWCCTRRVPRVPGYAYQPVRVTRVFSYRVLLPVETMPGKWEIPVLLVLLLLLLLIPSRS